jgi:hypothetical protein
MRSLLRSSFFALAVAGFFGLNIATGAEAPEVLGIAARVERPVLLVSTGMDGRAYAWTGLQQNRLKAMLIRVDVKTGEAATLDITSLGAGEQAPVLWQAPGSDKVIGFAGKPPRFIEIEPKAMSFRALSPPISGKAHYWLKGTDAGRGQFLVGLYPGARLVGWDVHASRLLDYGSFATDSRQQYLLSPVASLPEKSGGSIVYCPVGLARRELWAMNLDDGKKQQILPARLHEATGSLNLRRGIDGSVYGSLGEHHFRCFPDRIELVAEIPSESPAGRSATGTHFTHFEKDGSLVGVDREGASHRVPTRGFPVAGAMIFSLPLEFEGKLYGSTWKPQALFAVDLETGTITDHGRRGTGRVQIYDILPAPPGLILGSYTGGYIDLLPTPGATEWQLLASLDKAGEQERPVQLARGADGAIYAASLPIKGRLGGALSRISPDGRAVAVHRHVVRNQSVSSVVAIPDTSLLFCTTTVRGGSSSIPTEKEASIFLWDTKTQTKVKQAEPIAGAAEYHRAIALDRETVFCLASDGRYAIWSVSQARAIRSGRVISKGFKYPYVNPVPLWGGREVLLFGAAQLEVVNVDTGHSRVVLSFPELSKTTGLYARANGSFYYGIGDTLYRRQLVLPERAP